MMEQALSELLQARLFTGAQMVTDVPALIGLAEGSVVFRTLGDDLGEGGEAGGLRGAQAVRQRRGLIATQGPNRVDKRQSCLFLPRRPEVPDLVCVRTSTKFDRGISD